MKYFKVDKMMSSIKDEYGVWMKEEEQMIYYPIQGSFLVLFARIMGLSYPDFLRFVRDTYNARLSGKGHKYISFYFPTKQDAENFANMIDNRYLQLKKELILRS